MNYLVSVVETYRVPTVDEVQSLHEELKNDSHFTLISFSYKTKQIKSKGEILDEYQLVQVKKLFNEEKDPDRFITINYEVQ